ncbi:MAG: hypothetical protein KAR42_17320 [candidate division Zixibacteria bacterium]|nr:hypothetical protein [candidate division Zixibacteria bacterium]
MKPVIAFDSKEFIRGPKEKQFFCPIGGGVLIKDEQIFKSAYTQIFTRIMKKHNLPANRYIYDSHTISKRLRLYDAIDVISEIVNESLPYIDKINIYFTMFNTEKLKTIKVGGADKSDVKEIPVLKFLPKLNPTYVHCCAWDFRAGPVPDSVPMHIDYFEGKITKSWEYLKNVGNFQVFYRGDECNPFINLADLITWLTDKLLYKEKLRLTTDNIEEVWENVDTPVKGVFLGEKYLEKMVWISEKMIDTSPFLPKPTIFIVSKKPTLIEKASANKGEGVTFKQVFTSSPLMDAALIRAYSIGGGIKFFDPHIDKSIIKDGDIIVHVGQAAKEMAQTYNDMYEIEIISGKELRNKYKTPRLELFGK